MKRITIVIYAFLVAITKVFRRGNSQIVRIPAEFRIRSNEVEIMRQGDEIVLREHSPNLSRVFDLLTGLSRDFFRGGRKQRRADRRPRL